MASSSSLTPSQAMLSRAAIPRHGSTTSSSPSLSLPSFFGLKSTSTTTTTSSISGRHSIPDTIRLPVITSAAVETLNKTDTALIDKSVNTIRFLAIDAVEKANSGHPGLPMVCAPMGHVLYDEIMRYNTKNPYWFNRDRFVLSAEHGCMLQYALIHLAGYDSVKAHLVKALPMQWAWLLQKNTWQPSITNQIAKLLTTTRMLS